MPVPADVAVKRCIPVRDRPKRFYYTLMPFRFRHVGPYEADVDTFLHALVSRAKLVKIGGAYVARPRREESAVYEAFRARAARMIRSEVHKLSAEAFIASRPGRVRRLYQLAADSKQLESRGLRDMAKLKGFLKSEKSTHSFPHLSGPVKPGRPRGIQPRGPAFNMVLGPYTVPVEAVVFKDIDREFMPEFGGRVLRGVLKGLAPSDQAAEMRRHWDYHGGDGRAAFRSLDMSSFDATVDDVDLKLDHEVTQAYFPGDRTLKRAHSMQFRNQMRAVLRDGVVRTNLGPMRMSGDMNTSLGNCIISFAMAWEIFSPLGCTVIVNGDDVGVFGPRDVIEGLGGIEESYLAYGKLAVAEPVVDTFELCEFCQTRPVWDGERWIATRHWDKAMDNDYSGMYRLADWRYYLSHLHAVSSCGMAVASGIPILQTLYEWGQRNGVRNPRYKHAEELRDTGLYRAAMAEGGWRRARPVKWEARVSFHRAFGITPAMQEAIEQTIACLPAPSIADRVFLRERVPDNDNVNKSIFVSSSLALSDLQQW